jgi:hypothetical protein
MYKFRKPKKIYKEILNRQTDVDQETSLHIIEIATMGIGMLYILATIIIYMGYTPPTAHPPISEGVMLKENANYIITYDVNFGDGWTTDTILSMDSVKFIIEGK